MVSAVGRCAMSSAIWSAALYSCLSAPDDDDEDSPLENTDSLLLSRMTSRGSR